MTTHPSLLRLESQLKQRDAETSSASQFVRIAKMIIQRGDHVEDLSAAIGASRLGLAAQSFAKDAVAAQSLGDAWGTSAGRQLADSYLRTVESENLFDAVARYALPIPADLRRVLVAAGAVANVAAEGAPKVVTRCGLNLADQEPSKLAAILVLTKELAASTDQAAVRLFEQELRSAIIMALNAAIIAQVMPDAEAVAGGQNAVESLQAGLAAASDSQGYVVATTARVTRELALTAEGRMGIRGGEYIPGVTVLPALEEDSNSPQLIVIPASRLSLTDLGLTISSAAHASVAMSESPESPAELVSLWQTGSTGLLVEREFRMHAAAPAVVVG